MAIDLKKYIQVNLQQRVAGKYVLQTNIILLLQIYDGEDEKNFFERYHVFRGASK